MSFKQRARLPATAIWTPACSLRAWPHPWRSPMGFGSGSSSWAGCFRRQSRGSCSHHLTQIPTVPQGQGAATWGSKWHRQWKSGVAPIWSWDYSSCDWCSKSKPKYFHHSAQVFLKGAHLHLLYRNLYKVMMVVRDYVLLTFCSNCPILIGLMWIVQNFKNKGNKNVKVLLQPEEL